jgi:pyruvate formate lyase activating enzyme
MTERCELGVYAMTERHDLREGILFDKLENDRARCNVCPRRCNIADGKAGFCCARGNRGGSVYSLTYGKVTSAAVDPIEKKPLFHFHPGTMVFSIGGAGCNLRCAHCQNWQISRARPNEPGLDGLQDLSPAQAVEAAVASGCAGIAWTYNEPTIWLEYTIDTARLCREAGLYTAYVTNGYATEEAVDAIGPLLGAYRVDVKGFSDDFYMKLTGIKDWRTILAAAERAKNKHGCHVEIVTNIIPTMNDDESQLAGIAGWIRDALGPVTPWHVTRFVPYLDLAHLESTPIKTLEKARDIGLAAGLKFVYTGNAPGHPGENTYCPKCGKIVIERSGYVARKRIEKDGACPDCGEKQSMIL